MAISLISCEDNLTKTKIRCTVGCDYISDLDDIPVGDEDLSELGFANHKLAPWSFALVGENGLLYRLTTNNEWEVYDRDASGGGSGYKEPLTVIITDNQGEYTSDKTFEEIHAAKNNVAVDFQGFIYHQVVYTDEVIRFSLTDSSSNNSVTIDQFDFIQDNTIERNQYTFRSENVVITVSENQTINGYQVPKMTAEDVVRAYNAVIAAKACTLTDATNAQHFVVNQADTISDEICVSVLYYDKMILTYLLSNDTVTTEFVEIGTN